MADDPNLRRNDGWFVSSQPHEYSYFRSSMRSEFPTVSDAKLNEAINSCRQSIQPSEGREKLKACVRRKLGG